MANFKYKLKELEVGDITYNKGSKSTVTDIDPETGAITWDIQDIPDFETVFKHLNQAKEFMDSLAKNKDVRGDSTMLKIQQDITKTFNELRTHVRKNYPEEYARIKMVSEESTLDSNSGFTSGTEGENYATPFAFNPNKKAKGAAVNYYYKLGFKPAPKPKSSKTIDIVPANGKTKPLQEVETNVEEFINDLGIESAALKKHIASRVLGFNKVEEKLNELIPLLARAKQETLDKYKQNPDFSVVYGTDLATDYLDDLIQMFKNK